MQSSKVVEVDGVFVGAAIRLPEGWQFVSADVRASGADGALAATFADAQMLARRAVASARRDGPDSKKQQASGSFLKKRTKKLLFLESTLQETPRQPD